DAPLELLLGVGRYEPEQLATRAARDVYVHAPELPAHKRKHGLLMAGPATAGSGHRHADHTLVFTTWSYSTDQPLSLKKLRRFLDELPASIYRAKGFVWLQEAGARKATVQVVGARV